MLAPAATGSMTVIGNMTCHPCLTIRVGFTERRTREMPAFLNVEITVNQCPFLDEGNAMEATWRTAFR